MIFKDQEAMEQGISQLSRFQFIDLIILAKKKKMKTSLVGGFNNPLKNMGKHGNLPQFRGENKKYLKPPNPHTTVDVSEIRRENQWRNR